MIRDLNNNGQPDMVVSWIDNPRGDNFAYYTIGYDVNSNGRPAGDWTGPIHVGSWIGGESQGLSITSIPIDVDGDGIPNGWEQYGIDTNNDRSLDYSLPQANPFHKDIYVEVDYMQFHKPNDTAINHVIGNFSIAPVSNPDNMPGVTLHVQVDEQLAHQPTTNEANLLAMKNTNFGTPVERTSPNAANIIAAKEQVFHYAVFAHYQPPPLSGSSGNSFHIPNMEFIVTLGLWGNPRLGHPNGSVDQQEGTFYARTWS